MRTALDDAGDDSRCVRPAVDVHVGATSALVDAGTSTGAPLQDFYGNRRPQGPAYDIGAHEQ